MSLIARDTRRAYTPPPEGLHQGVCVDWVDLGMVKTQYGEKHKVRAVWQIEEMYQDPDKKFPPKRFTPMQTYTLSLNEKAKLRQHLEAWRGRKFTKDELDGFDLETTIGANCQLQIVHNIGDDGTVYGNIQAIVPLGKGMTKLTVDGDYTRMRDRDKNNEPGADDDVPF